MVSRHGHAWSGACRRNHARNLPAPQWGWRSRARSTSATTAGASPAASGADGASPRRGAPDRPVHTRAPSNSRSAGSRRRRWPARSSTPDPSGPPSQTPFASPRLTLPATASQPSCVLWRSVYHVSRQICQPSLPTEPRPPPAARRPPRNKIYFFSLNPAGSATSPAATSFDTLSVSKDVAAGEVDLSAGFQGEEVGLFSRRAAGGGRRAGLSREREGIVSRSLRETWLTLFATVTQEGSEMPWQGENFFFFFLFFFKD